MNDILTLQGPKMLRSTTTLLVLFWVTGVTLADDTIKPMPEEVLAAWVNAGAKTSWCGINSKGGILSRPTKDEVAKECTLVLPGFEIKTWPTDGLAKLPAPSVPFGLYVSKLTDAQAKEVAALKHLTHLSAGFAKITNAGAADLSAHEELLSLNICYSSKITDAGIKPLASMKMLTRLDIRGTLATDESVKHLSKSKNLVMLAVGDSKISDSAVEELRKALPKCDIKN